jgi:nucleotide-binding universal stress UspA family protein
MPLDHLRPEVHHQLIADLGRWASHTPCSSPVKLKVLAGWGRVDTHLAQLADEREADLLVVGSHRRNLAEQVWHGSISRSALHEATCNVLCVPETQTPTIVEAAPRVLVVPTDFSRLGDRAIATGYSLLERGSTVHLVHVVADTDELEESALTKLRARIPEDGESRGISSVVQVLRGASPWLAIWQYASRVSADLLCMAKHSREGVAGLILGSEAQQLLQHSRVPVVLVPPDRER